MANAVLTKDTTPTLDFADIASALEYWTQLDDDPRFNNMEDEQTGLGASAFTVASALTTGKKYYWRFRARTSSSLSTDQSNTSGGGSGNNLRDAAARTGLAMSFKPQKTLPVKRIILSLKRVSNPGSNVWVEIWSTSGGTPSAQIGTDSATVATSGIGTGAFEDVNFDFTTPIPLVAGTTYAIVLQGDFAVSGSDYMIWEHDGAGNYSNGAAFKHDGTPTFSSNGSNDHIFTTQTHSWGLWSPPWSIWVDSTALASITPTSWMLIDPDEPTDNYTFDVVPIHVTTPLHVVAAKRRTVLGDMLSEYTADRDLIELNFQDAYIKWDQSAEFVRFWQKRKAVFLVALVDYLQDTRELIWKVEFAEDFPIEALSSGRHDYKRLTLVFEESALS